LSASETTHRLFRSTGAATFSQIWRVGVTLGVQLLLRRFIVKEDWGVYEWALSIFLILGAVRDLGILFHVVRIPRPRPYGNLLLVQIVWGSLLAVTAFFGADLLALALASPHPEVVSIVRALALFLFLEGLASVPRVFFDAELLVGRTVLPEILRNLVFAVTSIVLALRGNGAWSLVIALILSTAVYAAFLWIRAAGSIPLHFERGKTMTLILHSLPLAVIWFLAIFVQRVDPLILGTRFDADTLGVYTYAYLVAFLVATLFVPALTRTLYPALVEYRDDEARFFGAYRLGTLIVVGLEAPAAAFLFVNAELSLWIIGGPQWTAASPLLRVLCFAPLIDPFSRLGGEVLKTHHKDGTWILSAAMTLASFIGFGWFLTGRLGAIGMAWANYLQLGSVVMLVAIYRLGPAAFRKLLADLFWMYAAPVLPFGAVLLLTSAESWTRFAVSIAAAALVFALYAWKYGDDFRRFFSRREPASPEPTGV